jgi:hypothetical protein
MLTSWYNGPNDLAWLSNWQYDEVPNDYAAGYALHLVVWSGGPTVPLTTPYGPACGQAYPLSSGFLNDMMKLAQIFNGKGPLYVSLFAEFQTYACVNSQWVGSENYWRKLKDQYRAAEAIFHQYAPNSRVSLCWGGWQTRWDDPVNGGGLSFFKYFADVMSASDFQSFQAMQSDSNVTDVQNMTAELHKWGPVMLAYYRPDNGSQTVFDADTQSMLTNRVLAQLTANGLFAWSFMDNTNLSASTTSYNCVHNAVTTYAAPWIVPPRWQTITDVAQSPTDAGSSQRSAGVL